MKSFIYVLTLSIVLNHVSICWCNESDVEDDFVKELKNNCYLQHWNDGFWSPSSETATIRTEEMVPFFTQDEQKYLWVSLCRNCESVRIIDPNNRTERIIMSPQARTKQCKHIWGPLISRDSFELIKPGDIIFVLYKGQMFIFKVTSMAGNNLVDQIIVYDRANISSGCEITRIKLDTVKWQKKCQTKTGIPVDHREINFTVSSFQNKTSTPSMIIKYDQYYGGAFGPEAVPYEDSAHIAIVHENDLNDNQLIDLTKFRFKTWEDGLGNLCEKERSSQSFSLKDLSQNDEQVNILDTHNGYIWDIAVDPNGNYIVSIGNDKRIVITDTGHDLKKIISPLDYKYGFSCLAINRDGNCILAAANPDYRQDILKINPLSGEYEQLKDIPFETSLVALHFFDEDTKLVYISKLNDISYYDLKKHKLINKEKIFGGFLFSNAASPQKDSFAVISQNKIDFRSEEPCKLTIFNKEGIQTLSYEFEKCLNAYNDKLVFLSDNCIALCFSNGEIWQWMWFPSENKWEIKKKIKIPQGQYAAIESSPDGRVIWLAKDNNVFAVDANSGKTLFEKKFEIGKIKADYAHPIMVIKYIPKKQMLAIGFGDGRIALLPIPAKLESTK